eukprot:SAG11_NODE_7276_length_1167_cov_2.019663_1_plen_207_part_01
MSIARLEKLKILRERLTLAQTTLGEDSYAYKSLLLKISTAREQLCASVVPAQSGDGGLRGAVKALVEATLTPVLPEPAPDSAVATEQDSARLAEDRSCSAAANLRSSDLLLAASELDEEEWSERLERWVVSEQERTSIGRALTQARSGVTVMARSPFERITALLKRGLQQAVRSPAAPPFLAITSVSSNRSDDETRRAMQHEEQDSA